MYHTFSTEQSKHIVLGRESVERFIVMILAMFVGTRLAARNLYNSMVYKKDVRRLWCFT